MAVSLATSSFTFRELLQQILPTLIAVCLFAPFLEATYSKPVDVTTIVLGSIVLSYLIAGIVRRLANLVFSRLPDIRGSEERAEWMQGNWDYPRLTLRLSKDENDLVELIGNYALFYKALSFYLLAYLAWNIYWLASSLAATWPRSLDGPAGSPDYCLRTLAALWQVRTPILGGWACWTPAVLVVAFYSVRSMLNSYVRNSRLLYSEGGMFDVLAEKYQKEKGGLALRVWGRVLCEDDVRLAGAKVKLAKDSHALPSDSGPGPLEAKMDGAGYFHFDAKYRDGIDSHWKISVEADGFSWVKTVKFSDTTVPSFIVEVPTAAGHNAGS